MKKILKKDNYEISWNIVTEKYSKAEKLRYKRMKKRAEFHIKFWEEELKFIKEIIKEEA